MPGDVLQFALSLSLSRGESRVLQKYMKTIYFVRHGQTLFNKAGRLQGRVDSPLSELGEQQVACVAKALKPLGIHSALVSPLGRAQQTAGIIQAELGVNLESVQQLSEVSFGDFEGNTLEQLEEKYPGQWLLRTENKWDYCPPQGESNADAASRAQQVIDRIEQWQEAEPLLIVAHFAINRIIMSLLADVPPGDTVQIDVPHFVIYRVQNDNGQWQLSYCDTEDSPDSFKTGWMIQPDPVSADRR